VPTDGKTRSTDADYRPRFRRARQTSLIVELDCTWSRTSRHGLPTTPTATGGPSGEVGVEGLESVLESTTNGSRGWRAHATRTHIRQTTPSTDGCRVISNCATGGQAGWRLVSPRACVIQLTIKDGPQRAVATLRQYPESDHRRQTSFNDVNGTRPIDRGEWFVSGGARLRDLTKKESRQPATQQSYRRRRPAGPSETSRPARMWSHRSSKTG